MGHLGSLTRSPGQIIEQEGHEALYRSLECKKVLEKDEVYEFGYSNYVSAVYRVRTAIMQASDFLFNYS